MKKLSFVMTLLFLLLAGTFCFESAHSQEKAIKRTVIEKERYTIDSPSRIVAFQKDKELSWVVEAFEDLFGVKPPRGVVTFDKKPPPKDSRRIKLSAGLHFGVEHGKDHWTIKWYNAKTTKSRITATYALTHEVAHYQYMYWAHASKLPNKKYKNNWLAEAIAVYFEVNTLKRIRRKAFDANNCIPLEKFFTMSHPATDKANASGSGNQKLLNDFYAQGLALFEYWIAKGGKPFIRFMVGRSLQQKSMQEILTEWNSQFDDIKSKSLLNNKDYEYRFINDLSILIRKGDKIGHLPANLDKMHKDWKLWIKLHYPNYKSKTPKAPY